MALIYPAKKGVKVRLSVPCEPLKGWGEYPIKGDSYLSGWKMDNEDAGTITKDETTTGCSVIYTHTSSNQQNVLTFTASDGRAEFVFFIPTYVHDHSTLEEGGPAYGTYSFIMDEELEEG